MFDYIRNTSYNKFIHFIYKFLIKRDECKMIDQEIKELGNTFKI